MREVKLQNQNNRLVLNTNDHTIMSHADVKQAVTTPVLNTPGSKTGKTATLLSYFDISSAEVRTLAFRSGDKNMMHLFESGQDIYIHVAKKKILGEDKWETLSKDEKKTWRKRIKILTLGISYGIL